MRFKNIFVVISVIFIASFIFGLLILPDLVVAQEDGDIKCVNSPSGEESPFSLYRYFGKWIFFKPCLPNDVCNNDRNACVDSNVDAIETGDGEEENACESNPDPDITCEWTNWNEDKPNEPEDWGCVCTTLISCKSNTEFCYAGLECCSGTCAGSRCCIPNTRACDTNSDCCSYTRGGTMGCREKSDGSKVCGSLGISSSDPSSLSWTDVEIGARDLSNNPLSGIKIDIYYGSTKEFSCITEIDGACLETVRLVSDRDYIALILDTDEYKYECNSGLCSRLFTPTGDSFLFEIKDIDILIGPVPAQCSLCGGRSCNREACLALGDCLFTNHLGRPYCKNKVLVNFIVRDRYLNELVVGVEVLASGYSRAGCITDNQGSCSVELAVDSPYYYIASIIDERYNGSYPYEKKLGILGQEPIEVLLTPTYQLCRDLDPGNSFHIKGDVVDKTGFSTDYCIQNELYQYQCDKYDSAIERSSYTCALGCEDGVCIRSQEEEGQAKVVFNVITETGALVHGVKVSAGSDRSSCITDRTGSCFVWVYAPGNYTASSNDVFYLCLTSNGLACTKDFSVVPGDNQVYLVLKQIPLTMDICYDTDGGTDYEEQGVAKDNTTGSSLWVEVDSCKRDGRTLIETFCNSSKQARTEEYLCPDECKDGACIDASESVTPVDSPECRACHVAVSDKYGVGKDICDDIEDDCSKDCTEDYDAGVRECGGYNLCLNPYIEDFNQCNDDCNDDENECAVPYKEDRDAERAVCDETICQDEAPIGREQTFTLTLYPGLGQNLISFPLELTNPEIEAVLAPIIGKFSIISDNAKNSYIPDMPEIFINTLGTTLEGGKAYNILITSDSSVTLPIRGIPFDLSVSDWVNSLNLIDEWYMV